MLIYIRHSDDEVSDPTHIHDPKLTDSGKRLAYKVGKNLIQKYGKPDLVFCSPFRRTKQTLKYMLRKTDTEDIKFVYDIDLSRYFSNREKKNPSVDSSTLTKDIPIYESRSDFHKRTEKLADKMHAYVDRKEVIWCITHTTVYKRMAKIYEVELPDYIPFMHHFELNEGKECKKCGKIHKD